MSEKNDNNFPFNAVPPALWLRGRKSKKTANTPQSQPLPGSEQVLNNAGGFTWQVSRWARLDRFLILGSEGGTYYVAERKLTFENAQGALECIQEDGLRVVRRVVEISEDGRAPKNQPALFVLALAASAGDEATRRAAFEALPRVARISTHLFQFMEYVQFVRGWGRGLRRAVAAWYTAMPAGQLAYQAVKYQSRAGWSHKDVLRLAHPTPPTPQHEALFRWMLRGELEGAPETGLDAALQRVWALEQARLAASEEEIIRLVNDYQLPWEAVPASWLGSAAVWGALLPHLPTTALVRNLARMTANGLLAENTPEAGFVVERLSNGEALRQARLHPIAVLSALLVYTKGQGVRGKLEWTPVTAIRDALDAAFYTTFQNAEPTQKRLLLALDISGSMSVGSIAGVPGLTPRDATAALALLAASTEPHHKILGFSDKLIGLDIHKGQRLEEAVRTISELPFGGTDAALPIIWAQKTKAQVDAFVVYTDNESWVGKTHPAQALQNYRDKTGIPAKLVVVAMTANQFSIADPNDPGMLDVVGFDTAAPAFINDFILGRV